jgi:hypothetical protein
MRLLALILAGTLVILPPPAEGQGQSPKPAIFLRQVRIDSILLVFGVDSASVRTAVVGALRDAGRLAPDTSGAVPSLDVDVAVPRPVHGGFFDPRGYIRVEVGRNLMESGSASQLLWERMFDLPASPTWREFTRGTLTEVLMAVNAYLLAKNGGA